MILSAVVTVGFGWSGSAVLAQGGDGPVVAPPTTQPPTNQNPTTPVGGNGGTSNRAEGGGEGVGEIGNAVELDPFNDDTFTDNRNQGFIGASARRIDGTGFIGRPGEISGAPLAEGALQQGGINDQSNSTVNIGGGGQGGAGFGAAANGVTIIRRSMRSKVRPSFYSPRLSDQQVASRFSDHFVIQPGTQPAVGSYSIDINNRTAVLKGSVNSQSESDRLVRQLRLEPGVNRIVNQLRILN